MLLKSLPGKICGKKVQTDFGKWLKVSSLLESSLDPEEKTAILLYNLFGKDRPQEDEETLLTAVMDFYLCGEPPIPDAEPPKERLLDWERDSAAVWADFRMYAGIDLDKAQLHWWEFMALFRSLPEDAAIRRRMELRALDLSTITDDKTRERYRKAKRLVSLENDDYDEF